MKRTLTSVQWLWVLRVFVAISILIPVGIVSYEIIVLGKNSVVFFAEYPVAVSIAISCYYGLLIILGVGWLVLQIKSLWTLKQEMKAQEILHLKTQINPHFFFNTLNNLYGWVDQDPEVAKSLILKLSDMMRYSIYEGEKPEVTIEDEITFLNQYIELHRLRYHRAPVIQMDIAVDNPEQKVHPLLFIILIENAFKHGVEKLLKDARVNMQLRLSNKQLCFEVENNFDAEETSGVGGIGLKNLKRRLELIYPKQHQLELDQSTSVYKAKLTINL